MMKTVFLGTQTVFLEQKIQVKTLETRRKDSSAHLIMMGELIIFKKEINLIQVISAIPLMRT